MDVEPLFKIPESVLVVIHTPERDVLLLERAGASGLWQSVTGSRSAGGEPWRETCRREVFEETRIRIGSGTVPATALRDWQLSNVYEIYPVWRHRYAPGVTQNTEHVFGLVVSRKTAVRISPREHQRFRWLPMAEAAERCFSPSNAAAIRLLPRFGGRAA